MWSAVFLTLVFTALLLLWVYVRKRYAYFRERDIPYAEPTFPFGNLGQIVSWVDEHRFRFDMYSKFKGRDVLGGFFTLTEPELILIDLDVIQDVLVNDFKQFPNHGFYYNEQRDPMSPHLYSLRGERWRNMRTKLSPAFSVPSIHAMFDSVSDVNFNLRQHIDQYVDQGKPFKAKDVSVRYLCDAIGSSAFGINCRAMQDQDAILLRITNRLFEPKKHEVLAYIAAYAYRKWADYIPWVATPKEVQHYFMATIKETLQYREENNVQRKDFLGMLLKMKMDGCMVDNESGEIIANITTDELISQAFALFFFGVYLCRVMLSFALFELASNQEIQIKARTEIYQVLGQDQELTYEKLEQMTYIQQIADETLRKYPPTPHLDRIANEDYLVKKGRGHVIEKGFLVTIPIMGIHHDPDIYPEPDEFDPDRMTQEKMKARHPSSFLPFGGGPRVCIAQRFGYLQVKLALVHLLSQYRLTVNPKTRKPRRHAHFLREFSVDEDIWLNAQRL